MYYIAYGSNLNIKQMMNRCPNAHIVCTSFLTKSRLSFNGIKDGNSYLTIKKGTDTVPVAIYDLTEDDIKRLDQYEGYPDFYIKSYSFIKINNHNEKCLIYLMRDKYLEHKPSSNYVSVVAKGYIDFDFDLDYLMDVLINQLDNKEIKPKKKIIKKS